MTWVTKESLKVSLNPLPGFWEVVDEGCLPSHTTEIVKYIVSYGKPKNHLDHKN